VHLLTPINWVVGALLIVGALFYPLIEAKVGSGALRSGAELQVSRIVNAERNQYFPLHEQYVYFNREKMAKGFDKLGLPYPVSSSFLYEVVRTEGGLMVRGLASESAVKSGLLPPLIYEYVVREEGGNQGRWLPLSGKSISIID
jgi:hypothetical protein